MFFTSYSRLNAKSPEDRDRIHKLIRDVENSVEQKLGSALPQGAFLDTTDIEAGDEWSYELSEAAATRPVAVCLYSPSYFNSDWCGREFQTFMNRRAMSRDTPKPTAVIPVLWMKTPMAEAVGAFQTSDDAFPSVYAQVGLRQLMTLERTYHDEYALVVEALSDRVVSALNGPSLPVLNAYDMKATASAWTSRNAPPAQAREARSVSKACFAYLASDGWHWTPYPSAGQKIGLLAQTLASRLNLQYVELDCAPNLPQELLKANASLSPTVIIGDPASITDPVIGDILRDYDQKFLINCGVLIPWTHAETDPAFQQSWQALAQLCPQKTMAALPDHEWRSIFSGLELESRAVTVIENIRGRLLQKAMASTPPIRIDNASAEQTAAEQGIALGTTPVVTNVSR